MSATTTHWFKQSLRELIIIVIGILLSLWVSNLFQKAQENQREQVYLERLQADLNKDLDQLKSEMAQRKGQVEAARRMLGGLQNPSQSNRELFVEGFQSLLWTTRFSPTNATFRSLESTGDLRLIRNDSIVGSTLDLYLKAYQALRDNNDDVTKYRDNFLLPYTTQNISFRKAFNPQDTTVLPRNIDQLFNHLVYLNISLQSTVNAYQRNIQHVEDLQILLSQELD